MEKKVPPRTGAGARFEDAAERVAAEIRRLDDVGADVRRQVRGIQWTGRSADQFRRHANQEVTRAEQNRAVLESLRVLLIRAAQASAAKPGGTP